MNYYSLNGISPNVSFKEAVIKGIAPDKGLYFPSRITPLKKDFIDNIDRYSREEIAFKVIEQFVGEDIPSNVLKEIIKETISFDFPLKHIENNIYTLELFHGPTMAFKDVGAKFMAKCLEYFNKDSREKIKVLVATSGDTGGAVAQGFYNAKGIEVVILYPSGKVSKIQEQQLTTHGQNVKAIEVNGVFDDCQNMVKTAFLDSEIKPKLTSANSINVARWLPQMFYYFYAFKELANTNSDIVFSVPSGNFGNICAGLMAQKLGLPIKQFVAATNINDTVPVFLKKRKYIPKASIPTISNAMDVGDPSNFIRILEIFHKDYTALKNRLNAFSFSDEETMEAMKNIYMESNYIADPHGAVGYLGLKKYGLAKDQVGIFLETAHPIKFLDIVERTLNVDIEIPPKIKRILEKKKNAITIRNYNELKIYLNES